MSIKEDERVAMLSALMLTDAGGPHLASGGKTVAGGLTEWLRHPLILLLISSAVIPSIVYFLAKHRDLLESRQRQAFEIVNKNSVFEGQLYSLFTELGLFHQTNQQKKPSPEELKTLQSDLDKSWGTHYLEFRRSYPDAHIWVDDLFGQGVILKLFSAGDVKTLLSVSDKEKLPESLPSDLRNLSDAIENYRATLSESLDELRKLRDGCISNQYDFEPTGNTSKIQLAATSRLNELRDERTRIIADMAGIFSR